MFVSSFSTLHTRLIVVVVVVSLVGTSRVCDHSALQQMGLLRTIVVVVVVVVHTRYTARGDESSTQLMQLKGPSLIC